MTNIPVAEVKIIDRQRRDFTPRELDQLKLSIKTKGLLHAIVCRETEDGLRLVAGERRIKAISALYDEGFTITHDGTDVPDGQVPYSLLGELSEDDILEAELEENLIRSALTWQEQSEARLRIYNLRNMQHEKDCLSRGQVAGPVSRTKVATELSKLSGNKVNAERVRIANAIILDRHKANPKVQNAKSEADAIKTVLLDAEAHYKAKLIERTGADTTHTIIKGDALEILPTLPKNTFAAIICDPPYGISADKFKKDEKHFYDDSTDYAKTFCETVIREGFRVCRKRAVLFMFCDIDHFVELKKYAQQQAWTVWRTPLVWKKGLDGHAPWGRSGFIRTTELILFAVKGEQMLHQPGGADVLDFTRTGRTGRVHAAEKPVSLMYHLIKLATLPGDAVLDPCAGSGPIIPAGDKYQVAITAIELDQDYYNQCLSRTYGTYTRDYSDEPESNEEEDLKPELFGPDDDYDDEDKEQKDEGK